MNRCLREPPPQPIEAAGGATKATQVPAVMLLRGLRAAPHIIEASFAVSDAAACSSV